MTKGKKKLQKCFVMVLRIAIVLLGLSSCNLFGPQQIIASTLRVIVQIQNATETFHAVGQIIRYDYVITNTGSFSLVGPVMVTDAQRPVVCPDLSSVGNLDKLLDPNETITCTGTYSIKQADLQSGYVTDRAMASVGAVTSDPSGVTVLLQNFVETAVAQGTPTASFLKLILTSTPVPTSTPTATPTLISIPSLPTNLYSNPVTGPILLSLKSLGGEDLVNKLLIALLSILGTALLLSLKSILRTTLDFAKWIFSLIRRLNKDYVFEAEYLDWIIGQYRHLGLLPAQVVARRWGERQQFVDLEQIYVRLSLTSQGDDQEWVTESHARSRWGRKQSEAIRLMKAILRGIAAFKINTRGVHINFSSLVKFNERFFPDPLYIPGSLSMIIDRSPRLVIKGDPGSGKTTLLRFLAVTCARTLRNSKEEDDSRLVVWQRLSWKTNPFPIIVRLSRHGDVTQWGNQKSLIDAFKDEMPVDLRRRCPEGFFERELTHKSCLILLDALDELGSPRARAAMAEYVNGFLEVHGKAKHRFVVTTRVIGYEGQLNSIGFLARTVQPLQEGERITLINQRYKAIAAVEKMGRTHGEALAIDTRLKEREHALIDRLKKLPRLAQLATNPMLLSLITLVHFLKVELPDERVLLYRDCVEILTERWQKYKRDELNYGSIFEEDLNLTQKVALLQEVAFAMQQRRDPTSSQALLPKKIAINVVANALSRSSIKSKQDEAYRKAEDWVLGIQTDSGILIEQGLDHVGEPLIGFSHLTFQEYLTAAAIKENNSYNGVLLENLVNPTWREVILLYVAQIDNATPIIRALMSHKEQPSGVMLAGWCLTERIRKLDPRLERNVVDRLKNLFLSADDCVDEIATILEKGLNLFDIIPFLGDQITKPQDYKRRVAAIRALGGLSPASGEIDHIRSLLVDLVDMDKSVEARVAASESLSKMGDPRFTRIEPLMVTVSAQDYTNLLQYRPNDFFYRINVFFRIQMMKKSKFSDEFEISRYPITNLEYSKFIYETSQQTPITWRGGIFPQEKGSHPVDGISYLDAIAFCRWLNSKTGKKYRLPSRIEWELAGGILEGTRFPWGNDADINKCNVKESNIGETTPVGSYFDVKSKYGVQEMIGNVGEFTQVYFENIILGPIVALLITWVGLTLLGNSSLFLTLVCGIYLIGLAVSAVPVLSIKGGSYRNSIRILSISATTSDWPVGQISSRQLYVGFRVVNEIKTKD
jgi:formylglycine-generating enzyme required for sulfatase activity